MQLINSTNDFLIKGIPHPNLPILVNSEMQVVLPVLKFIVYQAVQNGKISSTKTLKNYAAALYDFFSFLEANNLAWDSPSNGAHVSIVALYRNWSSSLSGKAALKRSTINTRLAALRQFYEFCFKIGMIDTLPWVHTLKIHTHDSASFLRHTRTSQPVSTTDLKLKTFKELPKLLNVEQIKLFVKIRKAINT